MTTKASFLELIKMIIEVSEHFFLPDSLNVIIFLFSHFYIFFSSSSFSVYNKQVWRNRMLYTDNYVKFWLLEQSYSVAFKVKKRA